MKKTNVKTKSPAPATEVAKPAKKKVTGTAKPTLAATSPVTIKTPVTVTPVATVPIQTKIVAQIDIGFGNALYVRGDGPGLSWDQGKLMQCVANDRWELALGESARPVAFKLLLNDTTWCTGADNVVASGATITVTPEFA